MIALPRPAPLLALLLVACGEATHEWKRRSPDEWVEALFAGSSQDAKEAFDAVVEFGRRDPDAVLGAIERRFGRPPPAATGVPFGLRLDVPAARRLGLPDVGAADALAAVLPVLRTRLVALGLVPVAMKGLDSGEIDLMAPGDRSPEQVAAAQAVLATRGALDLRWAVRPPGGAGGGPVYEGATPWTDLLAAEAASWIAAHGAETPHRPADPRWRVVPTTADVPRGPEGFVLVEEPRDAADTMDERIASRAEGVLAKDGTPVVVLRVRPERVEDVRRFLARGAGGELAVLFDGVARARIPAPSSGGETLVLPVGPPGTDAQDALGWANAHAIYVATGRLPWPLAAGKPPGRSDGDPPPDNVLARAALALGPKAGPMFERLAAGGLPWARASAAWALAQSRR